MTRGYRLAVQFALTIVRHAGPGHRRKRCPADHPSNRRETHRQVAFRSLGVRGSPPVRWVLCSAQGTSGETLETEALTEPAALPWDRRWPAVISRLQVPR